jgi:DNA-binding Lrp family transcriptional regulator
MLSSPAAPASRPPPACGGYGGWRSPVSSRAITRSFFVIVGLESQKQAVLDEFEALVANWPEVRECHMIRGGGDFLLKLVARDAAHENALTSRLTAAAHVGRVQTLQTIRTSRDLAGVPLERAFG